MPLSTKEEVDNKLKNIFYSKLLIQINTRKVDAYNFSVEVNKARPVVSIQLNNLANDGLLLKQKEGNKQLFSINWEELEKKVKETLQERKDVIDKLNLEYEKEVIRLNKLLDMKNNPNNIKEVQDVPIKRDTKTF